MKIAVIGGIGCGKSEAMRAFGDNGYAVLSADKINSELWQDEAYLNTLKLNFPEAVIDDEITKASLSKVVFADDEKRELLNSISHPLIVSKIVESKEELLAVELPLSLESGILAEFDHVVLIDTKKSLRLKRLEGRGVDKKRAKRIMAVQPPMKALRRQADVIILNNGTKEALYEKASMVADILNR